MAVVVDRSGLAVSGLRTARRPVRRPRRRRRGHRSHPRRAAAGCWSRAPRRPRSRSRTFFALPLARPRAGRGRRPARRADLGRGRRPALRRRPGHRRSSGRRPGRPGLVARRGAHDRPRARRRADVRGRSSASAPPGWTEPSDAVRPRGRGLDGRRHVQPRGARRVRHPSTSCSRPSSRSRHRRSCRPWSARSPGWARSCEQRANEAWPRPVRTASGTTSPDALGRSVGGPSIRALGGFSMRTTPARLTAVVLALMLFAAACGSSKDDAKTDTTSGWVEHHRRRPAASTRRSPPSCPRRSSRPARSSSPPTPPTPRTSSSPRTTPRSRAWTSTWPRPSARCSASRSRSRTPRFDDDHPGARHPLRHRHVVVHRQQGARADRRHGDLLPGRHLVPGAEGQEPGPQLARRPLRQDGRRREGHHPARRRHRPVRRPAPTPARAPSTCRPSPTRPAPTWP